VTHPTKQKVMQQIRIDLIEYFDAWFSHAEGILSTTNPLNRAEFLATVEAIQKTYPELGKMLETVQTSLDKTPSPMAGQLRLIKDEEE
jgi:hypothetical protein